MKNSNTEKLCKKCGTVKPLSEFYRRNDRPSGTASQCKTCFKQYKNKWNKTANGQDSNRDYYLRTKHTEKRKERVNSTYRERAKERKAKGLCVNCGKNPPRAASTTKCLYCYEQSYASQSRLRIERASKGICARCGKHQALPRSRRQFPFCEVCEYKDRAYHCMASLGFWEAIRDKLIAQNFTCPYTGKRLVLGDNASIDHILPRCRFPHLVSDPDNIEWVDETVNMMKRDLTPEEFFSLIREIAAHRPELNRLAVAA